MGGGAAGEGGLVDAAPVLDDLRLIRASSSGRSRWNEGC